MPATASRIAFITQESRVATAGPDGTVAALYGSSARDTVPPIDTYFDTLADASALALARLNLLKAPRRRIEFGVAGEETSLGFTYKGTTPAVSVTDEERGIDGAAAVVQFGVDFEKGQSMMVTWG